MPRNPALNQVTVQLTDGELRDVQKLCRRLTSGQTRADRRDTALPVARFVVEAVRERIEREG